MRRLIAITASGIIATGLGCGGSPPSNSARVADGDTSGDARATKPSDSAKAIPATEVTPNRPSANDEPKSPLVQSPNADKHEKPIDDDPGDNGSLNWKADASNEDPELESRKAEINQNVKAVLQQWKSAVRARAEDAVGPAPQPPQPDSDEELRLSDQIKRLQVELAASSDEADRLSKRIAENQKKNGKAWIKIIAKDEERLALLKDKSVRAKDEIANLNEQITAASARRKSELPRLKERHRTDLATWDKRVEAKAKELELDESGFPFLNLSRLVPGDFGRLPAIDDESLLDERQRTSVRRVLAMWSEDRHLNAYEKQMLRRVFGTFTTIPDRPANIEVNQVIDENNAIVFPVFAAGAQPKFLWIKTSTNGMIDHSTIMLEGLYMFATTITYETASGGSNTIPGLIKVDLKTLVERGAYFAKSDSGNFAAQQSPQPDAPKDAP